MKNARISKFTFDFLYRKRWFKWLFLTSIHRKGSLYLRCVVDFLLWMLEVENLHNFHQSNEILHIFVEPFICQCTLLERLHNQKPNKSAKWGIFWYILHVGGSPSSRTIRACPTCAVAEVSCDFLFKTPLTLSLCVALAFTFCNVASSFNPLSIADIRTCFTLAIPNTTRGILSPIKIPEINKWTMLSTYMVYVFPSWIYIQVRLQKFKQE